MKKYLRIIFPIGISVLLLFVSLSAYANPFSSSPSEKGNGTASGLKSNGIIECSEENEDGAPVTSMITSQDLYYLADCIDNIKSDTGIYKDISDALNAEIAERIAGDQELDKGLQDCFTSVSNGKQKLVEALLTKSLGEINLPADSTFEEIRDGILALKTTYSLADRDADIEYIYHTHLNTDGTEDASIKDDDISAVSGGCFTLPQYKIHHCSDSCYSEESKPIYHTHSVEAGCYTHQGTCSVTSSETRQLGDTYSCTKCGNTTKRLIITEKYTHSACGVGSSTYTYVRCGYCVNVISGTKPSPIGTHTYSYKNSTLSCTKSTTTPIGNTKVKEKICGQEDGEPSEKEGIECYTLGCKMSKDNIIGARIIFKK